MKRLLAAIGVYLLCLASALAQAPAAGTPAGRGQPAAASEPAALSRNAQRAYETTRDKLVQIRILLKNSDTQASLGSGFFVAAEGLIITNFHVASQLALQPERYRGMYVPVDGKEAPVELLAFDVRNDLALLRVKAPPAGQPVLAFRPKDEPLARGERIYSLGNPLDIGFAVTEGTFNGLVTRSFYPRIFFGGALNPGMSGGPALDESGRVVGVNVSKRLDGDLVSFLIPASYAQALLERSARAQPITKAAHAEVARQLMEHQELLTHNFLDKPLKLQMHGGYGVPVPDDAMARCWGRGRDPGFKSFDLERTDCQIDSHVFAGEFNTGFLRVRYEAYDAPNMGPLRFSALFAQSFRNEYFQQRSSRKATAAECSERYVNTGGMDMRAVICVSAYRKLPGLHDVSVLVMSLNQPTKGVQGRLDAQGVSFENGMKLVSQYLAGFKWEAPAKDAR
ncbi:MAG: serine protease [Comamonadaceae bacterium]|nr:MAG: serine protease [Comamonadaceae bacterium]